MSSDRIYLHHQSCNRVKVISDALKTIGSEATVRFSQDRILCIHYNHKMNVCIIIDINTNEIFRYEYDCDEDEVLLGVRPADLSQEIGSKKIDTLVMNYTNNSLKMGLYTTSQQNSQPPSFSRIEITEGQDVQHISATYPEEPHLKVTGIVFRHEMHRLKKKAKYLFIRPYMRGIQLLGRDSHNTMIYNVSLGLTEGNEELFFSPTEEDEEYDDEETYDNNHQSVDHDPLCIFDHIQTEYKDFAPLIGLSKLTSDSGLVKIYLTEDRNIPIKFTGHSGEEGTWTAFIQGMSEDDPELGYD